MNVILFKILMWIIAFNLFALGVLVIFLINARLNLKRDIIRKKFFFDAYNMATSATSSYEAAEKLGITREEFISFCKLRGIETPEEIKERLEAERKQEEEEKQRIFDEEAAWRAEQERIIEERRKAQEEDARKRKERLKKFGFK